MNEPLKKYNEDLNKKMKYQSIRNKILVALFLIFGSFSFYILCLNHVNINEIGITYHSNTGEVSIQEKPGWYFTDVFTKVITVNTSPFFVDILSYNASYNTSKVITRKLVRFDPVGVKEFVALHGVSYHYNVEHLMTGYAFSGNKYSFLEILEQK